ncbi:MAG: hypothetical protein RLZZ367_1045 [Bacteroidota bacterium]|jgi:outer membrane protein TolC
MKKKLVLSILLAMGVSGFAQTTGSPATTTVKAFTVQEAVDYALQFNNQVKNAKLGVDQAKWRNVEIYTTGLPQISGNFDYNYYFKQPISPAFNKLFSDPNNSFAQLFSYLYQKDPAGFGPIIAGQANQKAFSFVLPHSINTGLQVNQLFFDGRYVFGVKAAKELMLTARLQSQMNDVDVKYAVMKAYYQAAAASEAKALLQENLKVVEKLTADMRATFQQGLIEELDVNRLELAQATLESQIALQNQLAEVALANLKFQMGMPLGEELILKDHLTELKASVQVQDATKQFDARNRAEYPLLESAIKLKGYDMRQKRVQYFPSLYGFLSYSWNSQAQSGADILKKDSWFDQGLVGLTLKVPIFDSGSKLAQVKQAKLEQQKSINDFENFKSAADLQYRAAQSSFSSALTDETNTRKAQELSKKIFDRNTVKYKEGVANSFELQQSEQEFVTNQLKYIQSTLNLLNTKADLDKALGVK